MGRTSRGWDTILVLKIILHRLAVALPIFFIICTFAFLLVSLMPGDVATTILGDNASPEQYDRVREELGLNQPLIVRYGNWLLDVVQGNLGASLRTGQPVITTLVSRLPVTLSLALVAVLVTVVIGVAFGVIGALGGRLAARVTQFLALLGSSLPNFWIAIILVFFFSITFAVLPATGYVAITQSPADWARSLVLPVAAVALVGIASIARQTQAALTDVLSRDFVRALRAAGTPRRTIIFKHALRNAAIPVVTSISFQFISLLGGSFVIEQVFALPGLGQVLISSITGRDLTIVQGVVVISAILVIVVNLLVDLLIAWLNPKVRTA